MRDGRIDAAVLTEHGIDVLEFKHRAVPVEEAERQVREYARAVPGARTRVVRRAGPPRRELVLEAADALGAPASPRLNAEMIALREGVELSPRQYSSLRREDETSYQRRPGGQARYLVPAIDWNTLEPFKGVVAASDWPLEERIATPRALRLWHLRHTLAVLGLWELLLVEGAEEERSERAERVLWQLARSVPDALQPGVPPDGSRVREAVAAERDELEPLDVPLREQTALQLAALPQAAQLWGRTIHDASAEAGA